MPWSAMKGSCRTSRAAASWRCPMSMGHRLRNARRRGRSAPTRRCGCWRGSRAGLRRCMPRAPSIATCRPTTSCCRGGDLDRAVIIDFGIAKLGEPQAGTLIGGDIAGKASYMSPEQLGVIRNEVDARSDIYSLALTIAAGVRGRSLYASGSWAEVVESRRHLPSLDGIDEPLHGRLAHMLQPDPAHRPQSMTELLAAPDASGRPASGSPPAPSRQRGGAWLRPSRTTCATRLADQARPDPRWRCRAGARAGPGLPVLCPRSGRWKTRPRCRRRTGPGPRRRQRPRSISPSSSAAPIKHWRA